MLRLVALAGLHIAAADEPGTVLAFWRFEATQPSAYYRFENVLSDHSGHSSHLTFVENGNSETSYSNALDGSPENNNCQDDAGLGCTYLEFDGGYSTDKTAREDWVAYDGIYDVSSSVPPITMFNVPTAPKEFNITVRTDLYTVQTQVMPGGGGGTSFNAGMIAELDANAHLVYNGTRTGKILGFEDDFTLEGFFRTDGNQSDTGTMSLLYQGDAHGFSYSVTLKDGDFVFTIGGHSSLLSVRLDERNYADGSFHYFVARFDDDASGPGSEGKLVVKIGNEDGSIDRGLSDCPADYSITPRGDNLYIGGRPGKVQTFRGELDEFRIWRGLPLDEDLLGAVASDYTHSPGAIGCSGRVELNGQQASFGDGSEGDEYVNNLDCEWLIKPDAHTKDTDFIALRFINFGTEPKHDFVQVFDGDSSSAPLLGTFSGYDVPDTPLISTTGVVLVRFTTNGHQTTAQEGFRVKYVSMSLSERQCSTANEHHELQLSCSPGYIIKKVSFASYGTPTGFCSNGEGSGIGVLRDTNGHQLSDISNPNGLGDGAQAGAGAGDSAAGPVLFGTGFCHAESSRAVVEDACLDKNACSIAVNDATFGGVDPCADFTDSTLGEKGTDDLNVVGMDAYPRTEKPYFDMISKRLFVQVTCEGDASFASNCATECAQDGRCLYGLAKQFCGWCGREGLIPQDDGSYIGDGCGSKYCVKYATCEMLDCISESNPHGSTVC